ncbi:thioesterase II family protein [Streptomyces sp. XD-27]|uniref:thioesterase II family protein n=1 Tax=Streptomyces sp. XD-27 TaxID=3062779 RepID=UPI0026F474BE|nr:alpha/beta fold hydrolase [Streptomyces sp. XD-27]WKX69509.1 thioesterase domain-containing protein [Streptomyces sp. XD-27]
MTTAPPPSPGSLSSRWLRTLHAAGRPRVRLVCFPHAGGAAGFFRDWPRWLAPDIELLAVRYPGREDRILDEPASGMAELADSVAAALGGLPALPTAFFGHSMGASVAYEVALRMRTSGVPDLLMVSGRAAPHRLRAFPLADDEALVADVRRRGGPLAAALDHPELLDLVLPAIRADYRLLDAYAAEAELCEVGVPVAAFYGEADPDVPAESVLAWAGTSPGAFTARGFAGGGHFYLVEHAADLVGDIGARLAALTAV